MSSGIGTASAKQTIGGGTECRGWSPERKQRQRELIQQWKPWEKSTGPRTPEGKSRVSRNAYRGAVWFRLRVLNVRITALIKEMKRMGTWPPLRYRGSHTGI